MNNHSEEQEKNIELVEQLLDTAFNRKDARAAAEMLSDSYIQHNPTVPTGKAGFLKAIPEVYREFPDMSWRPKNIWADRDYVIVHSQYKFKVEDNGRATVDIFRIKDGKADEHWDVSQEIPDHMAHTNGMF